MWYVKFKKLYYFLEAFMLGTKNVKTLISWTLKRERERERDDHRKLTLLLFFLNLKGFFLNDQAKDLLQKNSQNNSLGTAYRARGAMPLAFP
jgi:hypothetical protein